ncbi:hypothetical protein NDA11_004106 [Ustilago hordei]|uniref:Uncharacterized protein n=1 Tax=Ustilago hordei TaxID=120017 RepID=I2FUS6_USTHO|nr:uncharacterized protein UHO2_07265 [Ustilago hordei]KAJ1040792.1 hypothetical protein NDA10_003787 [Ustilago hordei]KAJ1576391.1 hypothetical protein NDA12_003658 [Ustilago hordei]KAJ1577815.1 hypothetical protein NDA15_004010 [Ustilago hordei]KAJ1596491.1 hypothetical protein NDA11_004106 [Ustilago hordei]KAJ1598880.1 hypothetical protein NDA14_004404 [Ustilago hordei]
MSHAHPGERRWKRRGNDTCQVSRIEQPDPISSRWHIFTASSSDATVFSIPLCSLWQPRRMSKLVCGGGKPQFDSLTNGKRFRRPRREKCPFFIRHTFNVRSQQAGSYENRP